MDRDDLRALYPQLGDALRDYMGRQLYTRTRLATGTRLTEGRESEESEEISSGDLATICKGVAISADPHRSYLDQQSYGSELSAPTTASLLLRVASLLSLTQQIGAT